MAPTVVFDTNVLVAELGFPDEPERCVALAEAGVVEPAVSPPLLRELAAVLAYDRLPVAADREARARAVERVADFRVVEPAVEAAVPADPDDAAVLECALAAAADVVVSEDAHLLALDGVGGLAVRPREAFLALARRAHRNPEG